MAYYKKLEERRTDNAVAATEPADSKALSKVSKGAHADTSAPVAAATKKPSMVKAPLTNAAATQKEKPAAPALTNEKVVEMVKSGVDEDNVIVTIRQAAAVNFDISPDGQIQLAKNGVKGKIVAAMRERSRRSKAVASN